jgi:hypothetical protein
MKIAICLSGQPRWLDVGLKNLLDVFSEYNVDYFVHTWWDEQFSDRKEFLSANRAFVWKDDTIELIHKMSKPKILMHEPPKLFTTFNDVNYETKVPNSTHSMFYSIMMSNKLKKFYEISNNFEYDLVVRCRFDIEFYNFNLNLNDLDRDRIHMSSVSTDFPNDHFAISSSENMDYYSSLFENLENYRNEGFKSFVGERLLRYHLEKKNNLMYLTTPNELSNSTIHHIN